jgi:hypothetical protein
MSDATRRRKGSVECIQIKGRAFRPGKMQKLGKFNIKMACDIAMMVLLDITTLDPTEIWEAPFSAVAQRLSEPGSRARARGVLSVRDFKRGPQIGAKAGADQGRAYSITSRGKPTPAASDTFRVEHLGKWAGSWASRQASPGPSEAPTRAFPEKNESGGIPLRARIGFKNRTGRQASMRWGSRIQRICVSG